MKQFAIIGLGSFSQTALEELANYDFEIVIVDKNEEIIDRFKDFAVDSYVADVVNEEIFHKIIHGKIDTAIVDLGDDRETSILATHYLKKLGVQDIVVKAESLAHGEILKVVGATYVIFPEREAAQRLVPLLVSKLLFNYMPISDDLVLAEMSVPDKYAGMTLIQANFRKERGLNVVAIRKGGQHGFDFFEPNYELSSEDVLLVVGKPADVQYFSRVEEVPATRKKTDFFKKLFGSWKKR